MALTGVLRPGHAQVRVLGLDESVRFFKDVLGLVETGPDAAGTSSNGTCMVAAASSRGKRRGSSGRARRKLVG